MNGVIGITGLLPDVDLAPQHREYAEMIRASGKALLTIINDILDFKDRIRPSGAAVAVHLALRTRIKEVEVGSIDRS